MICSELFVHEMSRAGFGIFSGVPCSFLTPVINTVIDSPEVRYIGAANEGDAVAIGCGAELGGKHSAVMFQNSGFGNAVNPLTSLAATLRIPVLLITTWRGHPDERPADEPQHELMGQITPKLMDLIGIPWEPFPENDDHIMLVLTRALSHMRAQRTPYGLIMKKSSVSGHELETKPDLDRNFELDSLPLYPPSIERLDQDEVLKTIQSSVGETDVVLATTGFTGRALYALSDRSNQLYMVGSMGCVSSLGLGLAVAQPGRRVVALDGDGAALMRMGTLATIGHERPKNFLHILLDNAVHDSTGSQATASPSVDFAAVASACGYAAVARVAGLDELNHAIRDRGPYPQLLHVKTKPRIDRKLPRPDVTPADVAQRLQAWMGVRT